MRAVIHEIATAFIHFHGIPGKQTGIDKTGNSEEAKQVNFSVGKNKIPAKITAETAPEAPREL